MGSRYRKNHTLIDIVKRSPEAGLPLFDHAVAAIAERKVPLATETRDASMREVVRGGIPPSFQVVLGAFAEIGPASDREVKRYTGLDINIITARRNDLINAGLIEEAGKGFDPETKRSVTLWRVK